MRTPGKPDDITIKRKVRTMSTKFVGANIALMLVFAAIGLTHFSEYVRTVQIIGLFASGALFGVALGTISMAIRARQKRA